MTKNKPRRVRAASETTPTATLLPNAADGRRGGTENKERTVTMAVPETLNSATKVVALRNGWKFARTLVASLLRGNPEVAKVEREIIAQRKTSSDDGR